MSVIGEMVMSDEVRFFVCAGGCVMDAFLAGVWAGVNQALAYLLMFSAILLGVGAFAAYFNMKKPERK